MVWHWIVTHTEASAYGFVVGALMAWTWARRKLIPEWQRLHERQARIEDKLDPHTPGGITTILERLDQLGRTKKP
jgi:hypothetical protein